MSTSRRLRLEPWDVALHMMRAGRDPALITAYLLEEARRAGVDPIDLSMRPADVLYRQWRAVKGTFVQLVPAVNRFADDLKRALSRAPSSLSQPRTATGPP